MGIWSCNWLHVGLPLAGKMGNRAGLDQGIPTKMRGSRAMAEDTGLCPTRTWWEEVFLPYVKHSLPQRFIRIWGPG